MYVEQTTRRQIRRTLTAISCIPLLQIIHCGAIAQTLGVNPVVGNSTLDQIRPPKGDQLELQFPSGFTCRASSGDRAAVVMYGDGGLLGSAQDGLGNGIGGARAGMALVVPLYQRKNHACDKSLDLYTKLNRLELAEKLVTAGAMTNKEYLELATQIKKELLNNK